MASSCYLTHRPLVSWQKAFLAAASGIGSALNPYRADLVAASNETLGEPAFRQIYDSMRKTARGKRILNEKPLISVSHTFHVSDGPTDWVQRETLEECRGLASGSFGAAYAEFMDRGDLNPDERPPVRFIDDLHVAYVATRYRQVHDLWHVLLGCDTDMSGEVAVKAVEGIQTGLPNAFFVALLSPLVIREKERKRFFTEMLPWAIKTGFNASDLMSIYYEQHFQEPVEQVRRRWCITKAPYF